ncbi:hypothetical protein BWK63_04030 [Flavobacterium covae]|nr:hypothetical protein BWK63_04030 [Flavobacterium covae]POR23820.1 hypothetical protein BWK57_00490 [Flavobacterium columnare]
MLIGKQVSGGAGVTGNSGAGILIAPDGVYPVATDMTQSDIRNLGSTQTLAQNCILCPQQ